jgi:hypothetical protein
MPTINIQGLGNVNLSDEFTNLSPEDQNRTIDEIVAAHGGAQPSGAPVTIAPKGGMPRQASMAEAFSPIGASMGDIASQAASNLVPSGIQFAKNLAQPFMHPIDTATNLAHVAKGVGQKLTGGGPDTPYADALGQFFKNRYGSLDAIKNTIATDPVGAAADFGTVLSGGELAAGRAPGLLGTVARAGGTAARGIDPFAATVSGAQLAGKGLGKVSTTGLGLTTGTSGLNFEKAAGAGFGSVTGNEGAATDFLANLRGTEPMANVVQDARTALANARQERASAYQAGMGEVAKDDSGKVLDFTPIDAALNKVNAVQTFKGQELSPSTTAIRQQMGDVIDQWKQLDPQEYHTALGFDARNS